MPQILTSRRVRCRVPVGAPFTTTPLQDAFTSQTLESVRGNATRFEFGFFDVIGTPLDLSEVESLNLKLQPSQTVDSPLADKTITTLDLSLDAATWDDGSKQHAVFQFSNAEMNINPQGERRALWLVITAITTGGDEITLTAGWFFLHEDNNGSLATPPENPGAYMTLEQGDARYRRSLVLESSPVDSTFAQGSISTPASTFAALSNGTLITVGTVVYTKGASYNLGTKTFADGADLAALIETHPDVMQIGYSAAEVVVRGRLIGAAANAIAMSSSSGSVSITALTGGTDGTLGDYVGQLAISGGPYGFGHVCTDVRGVWRQIWTD